MLLRLTFGAFINTGVRPYIFVCSPVRPVEARSSRHAGYHLIYVHFNIYLYFDTPSVLCVHHVLYNNTIVSLQM